VNIAERQRQYAIGEQVGMITFIGDGTKKLRRCEITEIHGRGAKVKFLEGSKGGAFVFWNQIEKLEGASLPARVEPPAPREPVILPPPPVVLPKVAPKMKPARVGATSDDLDALIQMANEVANDIAVQQAQRFAQIKALEAEAKAIADEIERLREEHRQTHERTEALRKLGAMREGA